ncbi:GFA family protein [Xanthomonas hyacinthi]|uniref:Aldehyde-activating protein n=1 Tax=Xanthomonas hyacinthi TaxID=56455 RepID=A0A2S7EX70_9XANT|nr:aldehyde-activating protein [Xanthomonas hyacinthi]QGY77083.1 GFA family protein [Xanthomonas hyacinthi]
MDRAGRGQGVSERHPRRCIDKVGDTVIAPLHRLSCHCGAVQIDLELPHGIVDPRRCNCSLCRRRGAIVASVPLAALHVREGADALRLYRFNTHTAQHYFCGVCGIYTHHRRRSDPNEYGYNVGCLEGVDPYALAIAVPVSDGVQHPADRAAS